MDSVEISFINDENENLTIRARALEIVTGMRLKGAAKNKRLAKEIERLTSERMNVLAAGKRAISVPNTAW